jgi:phage terminase Nu1 subunit (DNA packaging protein)
MALYVNAKELANALDLSERRINQLVSEGTLEKGNDGKFNIYSAIESYVKKTHGLDADLSYEVERAEHEQIKKEMAQIRLDKLRNKVHDAKDVELVLTNMLVTFRTRMLGIPSQVAPRILGKKDLASVIGDITTEIKEALKELSEYNPEMFKPEGDDGGEKNN